MEIFRNIQKEDKEIIKIKYNKILFYKKSSYTKGIQEKYVLKFL